MRYLPPNTRPTFGSTFFSSCGSSDEPHCPDDSGGAMAAETGIDLKLKTLEFQTLLSQEAKGDYQASLIGWSGRVDPDGNIYTLYQTQTTSYVDAATQTVPTSVLHQTRYDIAASFWKQDKTELDGHGLATVAVSQLDRSAAFIQPTPPSACQARITFCPSASSWTRPGSSGSKPCSPR